MTVAIVLAGLLIMAVAKYLEVPQAELLKGLPLNLW